MGHGLEVKDLKSLQCNQIFRFGPRKQYVSKIMGELPIRVRRLDGKEDVLKVFTYLVDADVPFLCGKREKVERWNSKIEKRDLKEEYIFFAKGEEENLDTFKAIRKVHEV